MTLSRAALVVLMSHYLTGLLDPFITLVEVLRRVAGSHGPYVESPFRERPEREAVAW
jgi:hypothetical protein